MIKTELYQRTDTATRIKEDELTKINVENIPCYTAIGIDKEERKAGQKLLIDVNCYITSKEILNADNIKSTFSYVDIYKSVQEVGKKSHELIESLAEDIARVLLKHPLVERVKIKVYKPHIPYPEFQGNVSVEVERTK